MTASTRVRLSSVAFAIAMVLAAPVAPIVAQEEATAAQEDLVEAIVVAVLEDREVVGLDGKVQPFQLLEMRLTDEAEPGRTVVVEHGQFAGVNVPRYDVGDKVLLTPQILADGSVGYYVTDAVRTHVMLLLALAFVALTIAVGRWRGVASLASMLVSFLVLFLFVLPRIAAGADPIATAIAGAAAIIPIGYFMSHGLNRKTSAAVVGTLCALLISGMLARIAAEAAKLTGLSTDEALSLQFAAAEPLDMRGLLLASVIIGLLGVLDDVTVSQAAIVNQLRQAVPGLSTAEVLRRAMDVGTDHIASVVNTLVLVYASTAMPLLVLFAAGTAPFRELINYEPVAEEIVRALVASIGLILAVPLTTAVAAFMGVGGDGGALDGSPSAAAPADVGDEP